MAPIHEAASKNDLVALRCELDAGVSPDLLDTDSFVGSRPLHDAIVFGSAIRPPESIRQRLACVEALLDAGVPLTSRGPNTWSIAHYAA